MIRLVVLCLLCLGAAAHAAMPPAAGDAEPPAALADGQMRQAEAALAVWGYDPASVDGVWDAEDAAALEAWQADWGLPQTGQPTPDIMARLLREHPATRPQWVETADGCRVWNRYPQAQETVRWTGDCIDGLSSGEGVLTWTSVLKGETRVETYEGTRRRGREDGQGTYVDAEGGRYVGGWQAGLKHGRGVYVAPEGHRYEGSYRDGLRHGYGVYERAEGSRYEGAWQGGVQHGFGVAEWPDGSRYEGMLADGLPEGEGTLTFPNGNVYSGHWSAGCFAEAFRGATAGVEPAACGFGVGR